MGFFSRTLKHTKRYTEIISILITYGMGDLLHKLKIADTFPFIRKLLPKKESRSVDELTRPEELRLILEELGPTFVKLGQMLSNRPDILPPDIIVQLEKLQDTVPPFSSDEAVAILEEELKKPVGIIFKNFDKAPVASASMAQVHSAHLHDGTHVAVKIQRPNIKNTISVDLEILFHFAQLAERNIEQIRYLKPTGVVKEFEISINRELDFARERLNMQKFHSNFKDDDRIYVPLPYKEYCSKKIITMDFVEGVKVSCVTEECLANNDRHKIAHNGANLILKQIFEHGFFHADPHPGNIIILPDNKICFIDFGMMGSVIPRQQDELGDLILALVYRDTVLITNAILVITKRLNHPQINEIEHTVQDMVDRYLDLPLEELNISEVLTAIIGIIQTFRLNIPVNLTLMAKALITIEGIGLQLDPSFQIFSIIQKFSSVIIKNKFNYKRIMTASILNFREMKRLLEHAPGDILAIIEKIKQGKIKIEFEHRGLSPLQRAIDSAGNRIIIGVTLGSLIIGSSIMVHADIAPKWHGIPLIGVAGFLISGIFAMLVLIASIFWHFKDK